MNRINMKTPKGGKPVYLIAVALKDDLLGSLQFANEKSALEFKNKISELNGYGFVELVIDCE